MIEVKVYVSSKNDNNKNIYLQNINIVCFYYELDNVNIIGRYSGF